MSFMLSGLHVSLFQQWFGLSDDEVRAKGGARLLAGVGYPCRITLRDVPVGEPVLLIPFEHQPHNSPYRSSGPIFVQEQPIRKCTVATRIPDEFRSRLYSARGYNPDALMVDADVAEGSNLEPLIERLFNNSEVDYVHLHHARRGCFACRVDRL